MALLWVEGFEGFGDTINTYPRPTDVMSDKYDVNREVLDLELRDGRFGGYAMASEGTDGYFTTPALTTDATLVCGCAYKYEGTNQNAPIMQFFEGINYGMSIFYLSQSGEINVNRGFTSLAQSVGVALCPNKWYWIEFKVFTHDSNGSYEVRVSGETVMSDSGIDTQPGSNAYHDRVRFRGFQGVHPTWDDIYILDPTGSEATDFLGNVKVTGLNPNGDDTANFTTSTPNASHYANVDENPADDDTSYVEDGTANTTDLYDYEDMSGSDAIIGMQINTRCEETDVTPFTLITPIESNGTQDDDAGTAIASTTYVNRHRVSELDPDTGNAWTVTAVNAAKFGVKVG